MNYPDFLSYLANIILGTGWLSSFVSLKNKKKKETADTARACIETRQAEFDSLFRQIEVISRQNNDAYELIEKLQGIINSLREEVIQQKKDVFDARREVQKWKNLASQATEAGCAVENCPDRKPITNPNEKE